MQRVRHRIPSVFSISMVDVLCCALGCVILLWLLNVREAKTRAAQAAEADAELARVRAEGVVLTNQLDSLRQRAQQARQRVEQTEQELQAARTRQGNLAEELRVAEESLRNTQGEKAQAAAQITRLERDLAAVQATQQKSVDAFHLARREAETAATRLAEAESRSRRIGERLKELEAMAARRAQEEERGVKELALTREALERIQGEKKELVRQAEKARADADNRFAGIELKGKRVLCLVDMSGSMDHLNRTTPDRNKWPVVCNTVARVLRSLPELEKYQVILFSDKATFPLGAEGEWLDAQADSANRTHEALQRTKPAGDTNMYGVLEVAFRYRTQGLDTIYLFSDGLPNQGLGLSPEEASKLKETAQAEILGRYVRRKLKEEWNRPRDDQPPVRINTVGFYYESPDVGAFLWALARENDGSFVGMSYP